MSIQIITGFSLNNTDPIDTRIVASGSTGRDAIPYKYEGLRVFDLSNNRPYVYVGATWSVEVSDQVSGLTGSIGKFTSSSIISDSDIYQIGTGLTSKFGFGTSNPLGFVQVGDSSPSTGYSYPFVIHKAGAVSGVYAGSTVLGHNWYYTSSDQYFNSSVGSSNLVFGSYGDIIFQNKSGGPGSLINSIYISPSGKVGIGGYGFGYQPSFSLQVAGTVSGIGFIGSGAGLTNISSSSILNPIQLSVGSALTASNVIVTGATANATHYLTFVPNGAWTSTTAAANIKANTSGLLYNPGTGLLTVNGTMKHVSPTFSSLGSFVIGTGNLSRTTQITIASATYDRVIYVYSSSNSNYYYSTSGFFEIEIYIISGAVNQQIYTIFHGNDSDVRPTGIGYNYILPAGSSSTISLYKGNSSGGPMAWNTGTGPTIYATSMKFGL
jgi:hypothetical protein